MLYQAYNQTPSQTIFDFSAKYEVVSGGYNPDEVYFLRQYDPNDYVVVDNITSETTGYYYKLVNGVYKIVYLPDDLPLEFSDRGEYTVGDFVLYEGKCYECTTPVSASSWNEENWSLAGYYTYNGDSRLKFRGAVYSEFDSAKTYQVGDRVIHYDVGLALNVLYDCIADVTTPGSWTGNTNWMAVGSNHYDFISTQPYYDNPFSFLINGNSNFYGYRIQIYRNSNNALVYDSGNISRGKVVVQRSGLVNKSDEYSIYPFTSGSDVRNISIAPNDSRGNNVKVNVYLPKGIFNNIDNGPNERYNWVLTQYYSLQNNGEVDTEVFVRNSPVFFLSMPAPMLGIRGYRYNIDGNQTYISFGEGEDQTKNYKAREIYLDAYLVYYKRHEYVGGSDPYIDEYCVDNYFNYLIEGAKWSFTRDTNGTNIQELGDKDFIVTSSLNRYFGELLKGLNGSNRYKVDLDIKYQYQDKVDVTLFYLDKLQNNTISLRKDTLYIIPTYETSNLQDQLNFTATECQKQQYVELKWDANIFTGRYFRSNGGEVAGSELLGQFKEFDGQFNNGEGVLDRTLTSLYVNPLDTVVYSSEYSSGFKFAYNKNQLYFRYCNIDNILADGYNNGRIITLSCADIVEDINREFYLDIVPGDGINGRSVEHLYIRVNYNPNIDIIDSPVIYGGITNIQADCQCWQTIAINLRESLFSNPTNELAIGCVTVLNYASTGSGSVNKNCGAYTNLLFPTSSNSYDFGNPNKNPEGTIYKGYNMNINGTEAEFGEIGLYPRTVEEVAPVESGNHEITILVDFDSSKTYQLGDRVIHSDALIPNMVYECIRPVTTPGAWTGVTNWSAVAFLGGRVRSDEKVYVTHLFDSNTSDYTRYYAYDNTNGFIEGVSNIFYPSDIMTAGVQSGGGWDGTPDFVNYEPVISNNIESQKIEQITISNGLFDYLLINNLIEENNTKITGELYYKQLANIFAIADYSEGSPNRIEMEETLGKIYFLANFNSNQLNGGALALENEDIKYWEISRINAVDNVKTTVGTINASQGGTVRDYNIPNNWEGYYELSPASNTYLGTPVLSNGVVPGSKEGYNNTNWDGYSLLVLSDPDENNNRYVETVFYWRYNVSTGDMTNNTNYSVQETLKQYKRISKSQTNAVSGSLQALLGYYENGVYYGDSVEVMDKLYQIQMANKTKILKDRNGKNYVIEFTNPLTFTQDNNGFINSRVNYGSGDYKKITVQPTTVKMNWIEVESNDDISALTIL